MGKDKLSNKKEILDKIKKEKINKLAKSNITWRFDPDLLDKFRKDCEKENLSMNEVIEAMIKSYLGL